MKRTLANEWDRLPAPARRLLLILLAADVTLVVVHAINRVSFDHRLLRIDVEAGLGEVFQYGKFAVVAAIFLALARRHRTPGPVLWAAAFVYLALDDALAFHEWVGERFASVFGGESGATWNQVSADLVVAGLVLALVLIAARGAVPDRNAAIRIIVGLLVYGLFAGGVDVAGRFDFVLERRWLRGLFVLVEEGGELASISLVLALAYSAWLMSGRWISMGPETLGTAGSRDLP